ncbi:FKBP-type peptidyl-prolyl cis-trans isomerase [Novosphingobium cyanobacteriorum]|uniref:Peptidyl-prolyl cis-trans isomerase n=1 Tax=Novosphingobium cyanobacteriorum TaxID=3024215 RepID=A0ABT6CLU7_9SPHN|nr:FKBP-type peptidyl-prolyl cis-trans isomerase [Novosphingobium cyanobacteriorum]MDF8334538.1 FKBP-type peptidyl-prolyl cis-trans isomerase [Novosphingobium cyanobacteriorum]
MSEITRVPLQPIAKGSLGKLWLGVVAALALGGAVAYGARYHGLEVETVKAGAGPMPTVADVVLVNYVGHLTNGKEFDRGEKVAMPVEGVIPGFSQGLQKMQRGGKYKLTIPAAMAYGDKEQKNQATGEVVIPANSDLVFEVELVDFKSAAELEQQRRLMQQLQQQMQGRGGKGAPGGAVPGMEAMPGMEPAPQQ